MFEFFFHTTKELFHLKNLKYYPKIDEIVRLRHVLKIKYDRSIMSSNDTLIERDACRFFFPKPKIFN